MACAEDFPHMRGGDVFFKLGNRPPLVGDDDAEFTCDRHRPYCGSLLEVTTELTNLWNSEKPFPCFVKDTRYIFETAAGAREYYKRGWRYLSENWVPNVPDDTPDDALPPTEQLYGRCAKVWVHRGVRLGGGNSWMSAAT
eukprot:m.1475873 g.1475873  ORF g.1475873 m.1475873 type:complete len:140 (-) comp25156_c0_seq7:101-520(-)